MPAAEIVGAAVGVVGPSLALIVGFLVNWRHREPLARSLRHRERLQEQARDLDAIGEYEWARRRHHAAEMAVAMRLSRFDEYREHPVWAALVMIIPMMWGVGFVIVCSALLMGMSGLWGWIFGAGTLINLIFGLLLLVLIPVHAFWFDWKVRRRALRRVVTGGRARRARNAQSSPGAP